MHICKDLQSSISSIFSKLKFVKKNPCGIIRLRKAGEKN